MKDQRNVVQQVFFGQGDKCFYDGICFFETHFWISFLQDSKGGIVMVFKEVAPFGHGRKDGESVSENGSIDKEVEVDRIGFAKAVDPLSEPRCIIIKFLSGKRDGGTKGEQFERDHFFHGKSIVNCARRDGTAREANIVGFIVEQGFKRGCKHFLRGLNGVSFSIFLTNARNRRQFQETTDKKKSPIFLRNRR